MAVYKFISRNLLFLSTNCRHISYIPKGRLDGKVALVTASTDGIGYGIAERLAREGAKVVISSRKQKNVDEALEKLKSQNLNVHGLVCHVGNPDHRKNLFTEAIKQFGGVNILISNAAVNPTMGGVLDCDEASWDKIFDVNVKSAFLIAKEALPYLRQQKGGKIIFISSIAGYQPFNELGAYSVSKTTLIALAKSAALQLAEDNITVNCVAPGIIKTNFAKALTTTKEIEERILASIPLGRFGLPEDIAGTVAFLVSDDANYITGETIVAAGGSPSRL